MDIGALLAKRAQRKDEERLQNRPFMRLSLFDRQDDDDEEEDY
jgi:hypothetical protein